ncbi:glycine cleavage system aminomethyltransferase GcvT [Neobacillus sp. MER 74]|uniref:glycine cleavage system aminomethyltransferase GcvT n=1 Tax=Neobacillus sp. MER 74 TaxID=2939566 RepID=UPI00203D3D89|nr:glycine cleavage system aminomethyltransferase GcvT [Neobacillus sp. MER 74]MCM3113799.1 glycine cleavage system aminomethyltransferase GcvT [Neobacillus sp. MER 74]
MTTNTLLKRTPLFETYKKHGAKVIDFGGWELPVQFSSILEEHESVRNRAGLFDVSHMGEVVVEGKDAESYINYLVTNDVTKLSINQAQYTAMCYQNGGTVDDLLVYKLTHDKYLLVINAANIDKDFEWMKQHVKGEVTLKNISNEIAQLAIQGPEAERILQKLTETNLSEIGSFKFAQHVNVSGITDILVSRTGYTGENGFELYLAAGQAEALWEKLIEAGCEDGLKPCGLGARDTLRLEARLALYGQELLSDISPLEAGIGFAVKTNKESDFIGKEALLRQKEEGLKRKLVGIEVTGRGIPRHGYKVVSESGEEIGVITSGTQSPTLKKSIGLALISAEYAQVDTQIKVEIRNKQIDAVVIKTPFYKMG